MPVVQTHTRLPMGVYMVSKVHGAIGSVLEPAV